MDQAVIKDLVFVVRFREKPMKSTCGFVCAMQLSKNWECRIESDLKNPNRSRFIPKYTFQVFCYGKNADMLNPVNLYFH